MIDSYHNDPSAYQEMQERLQQSWLESRHDQEREKLARTSEPKEKGVFKPSKDIEAYWRGVWAKEKKGANNAKATNN